MNEAAIFTQNLLDAIRAKYGANSLEEKCLGAAGAVILARRKVVRMSLIEADQIEITMVELRQLATFLGYGDW